MMFLTCSRNSSATVKRATELLLAIVATLLVCLPGFSQGSTGTIQGGIFDSTGGAIAGARVTVTDVARGTSRNLTTDESGQYVAPALTAGTYTVRAEAAGFTVMERTNVLLPVTATVRVDLTLSPGAQTQTVTVTEEIPAIDPTSATLGGTVTNQAIVDLPLNGRNFLQLLQLRPGVVDLPGASGNATSTNGRRQGADVLLIEGITQFDLATSNVLINGNNNGAPGATLPIDAISEFNTQQNAPAEYGWRDGSVVNVGVKSGTNALHGTAYAFGRYDEATGARNFFTGEKSKITRQQFGATAGGPIVRDKLFWFVGYEGIRERETSVTQIDTPSSIAGLGSAKSMFDACMAVGRANVNPLSAQLAGLTNPATCDISAPSDTVQNEFHYNPSQETSLNVPTPSNTPGNNGLAKVDWNLTERHHLNGMFFISKAFATSVGGLQPYWASNSDGTVYQYSGAWTWTVSSNWLNDFRFGESVTRGAEIRADADRLPSDPYPTGYSFNTGVTNPEYGGFPCIIIEGFDDMGTCGKPGQRGPQGQLNFRDSVSYLRGNHAFRFGAETVIVRFNNKSLSNLQGTVSFAAAGSVSALRNFLTGTFPSSGGNLNLGGGNTSYGLRERWYSAFFGDTWRVTPRLTLTPGVRYEYMGPPHEIENYMGTFDPTATGGLVLVGPGLSREKLFNAQKANFAPRVGAAWDIFGNGRTVLRGGVGLFTSFPSITSFIQAVPFGSNLCSTGTAAACTTGSPNIVVDHTGEPISQVAQFNKAYVPSDLNWSIAGPLFPGLAGGGAAPCTGAALCQTGAPDPDFKYPKSLQWNMDIQRAITNNLTLDVAYVGNHGYDETLATNLNAVPVGVGWNTPWTSAQLAAQTGSPASKYSTNAANVGKTSSQICLGQGFAADTGKCRTNAAAIVAARPYNTAFPWFSYIVGPTSGGWSNYNGLQVTVDGRNYRGVSFLASYTYAHALDTWSRSSQTSPLAVDPNNYGYQYGNGDRDIRHRARFSPRWAIPSVKSPAQILEGWTLSTIISFQGGFAWGPTDATKNDWAGNAQTANSNSRPNNGVWQTWNYSGPRSAFNSNATNGNTMPCYGVLAGCTPAKRPRRLLTRAMPHIWRSPLHRSTTTLATSGTGVS
jgi:hypothetical protein